MRRLALLLPFALAACNDPPPPAITQTPPAQPAPVAPAPPPTAAAEPMVPAAAAGSFAGFRDTRFGMDEAAFRAAWKDALGGNADGRCYFLYPAAVAVPADFAFMFEDGRFVRYSTEKDAETAPGGGKVGMTRAQIDALYPGRIEERPHKYTDGKYLRITSDAGDNGVLVFETDAAGNVTEWRVGVEPQVDYVEGCS